MPSLIAIPLVVIFTLPAIVFFQTFDHISPATMFPLFGLYAFVLLWFQFVIGSSTRLLIIYFPGIIKYHRSQGLFVLIFSLLHPFLIIFAFGLDQFISYKFLPPLLRPYAILGTIALILMLISVLTARFNKSRLFYQHWRKIHFINYLVFPLAWVHSYFIGSHIRGTVLEYLWYFFAGSALVAVSLRLRRATTQTQSPSIQ